MTRTDLREHFSGNRRANEINRALALLLEYRRTAFKKEISGGRPCEALVCGPTRYALTRKTRYPPLSAFIA